MTVPAVVLNQLDNQLGIVDPGGERLAIVGQCSSGPLNTPGIYSRRSDVVSTFGAGPLVEAACHEIETTGKALVLCRTDKTTVGAYSAITKTGTGTSVITADAATEPFDDYEVRVNWITGATIGVAGATYQYSLDGGRNFSAIQALGTAVFFTIAESNTRFNLAAGTIVAGDFFVCTTTAPLWNGTQLASALLALQTTDNDWGICLVEGPVVAADVTTIATAGTNMQNIGKERTFVASFRYPNAAETEAQYKTAFDTAFGSSVNDRLILCAGACELQSPISQRRYRRRIAPVIATSLIAVRPGIDIAAVKLGALPASVRIRDDGNNPKHHDELLDPGLDDSRATTLRTWYGRRGVYVNNPRILCQVGSDFKYAQHRRVMNLARSIVLRELQFFASDDLFVSKTTGYILEEDASKIDSVVNAALENEITDQGDASACIFQLSRTDNILSTFILKGALKVTPKAYPKTFQIDVGFFNPALKAQVAEV